MRGSALLEVKRTKTTRASVAWSELICGSGLLKRPDPLFLVLRSEIHGYDRVINPGDIFD